MYLYSVNMLLEKYGPSSGGHNHQISIDAVLVTITPLEISGNPVKFDSDLQITK